MIIAVFVDHFDLLDQSTGRFVLVVRDVQRAAWIA